jgi:GT2 family glycosyltransferase
MLRNLLLSLNAHSGGEYTFDVNVVDNDSCQSAKQIVDSVKKELKYNVRYFCEPQKNIAKARNRAVLNACGEYVVFIDDDEFPDQGWLFQLIDTCRKRKVHGVLGPVLPHYDGSAPRWLKKSGLCDRKRFKTSTVLRNPALMRTGNVLLRRDIFSQTLLFNERFGLSGGEDSDFFREALARGYSFVWCDEACVYEHVPPERCNGSYHLKRALLRGAVNARRETRQFNILLVKSAAAVCAYTFVLPLTFLAGRHFFMKYLVKNCDHLGRLLGAVGIEPVKDRSFIKEGETVKSKNQETTGAV